MIHTLKSHSYQNWTIHLLFQQIDQQIDQVVVQQSDQVVVRQIDQVVVRQIDQVVVRQIDQVVQQIEQVLPTTCVYQ